MGFIVADEFIGLHLLAFKRGIKGYINLFSIVIDVITVLFKRSVNPGGRDFQIVLFLDDVFFIQYFFKVTAYSRAVIDIDTPSLSM